MCTENPECIGDKPNIRLLRCAHSCRGCELEVVLALSLRVLLRLLRNAWVRRGQQAKVQCPLFATIQHRSKRPSSFSFSCCMNMRNRVLIARLLASLSLCVSD